ncbi:unknown transmembrane protein [Mesoplasma florum W37]|uniref:Uncharacterized protein n=1 Tax=Mesoplasma florum TaxID=2151 RepID=A0AAD0MNE2_MESFO|nr:hypothetical protein [Mesoplasma florum]AGY41535.1 unknown transmembrane protein [Mesoplasma florum W37]AVN59744.1 hypothetical protein CG008_02450 [Mesoplasma florum]AVN65875.1 hypothetical protein MflW12_4700 [Mesoplasma florum]
MKEKVIKQKPSKEEKKFNKKVIRRKNGILLNLFGSSTTIIGLIMFSLISILIFIYIRQENFITLVDNLEKDLKTNIEKLINDAIQTVKDKTNPEEIYQKVIESLNTSGITIKVGNDIVTLSSQDVIDLFNQVLPEEKFVQLINDFLDFGEIKIPDNVNLDLLRDLIKKLKLDNFNEIMLIIVIVSTSVTIMNLLNIIFAWRLMLVKNKIIKILFIITSVLSINIFSWIGSLVYLINDQKEVF